MKTTAEKTRDDYSDREARDANRDPITGEPGAHPVGVGVGAASAGAAGAAIGAVAGPIGGVVGGVVGAVAGGAMGKGVAEAIDPTVESDYWRTHHSGEPYYNSSVPYEDYEPAYRLGYESYGRADGRTLDEIDDELRAAWEKRDAPSRLDWESARPAVHAAWNRVDAAYKGD
jgi:hypothetical protein